MTIFIFIIKFRYNARPDWLKQRALSEYRCTESRCHAISPFVKCLEFSLFFCFVLYSDVLYNLENESEVLASMDIDHPLRNSTNNTVGCLKVKFPKKLAMKTQSQVKRYKQTEICKCQPRKLTKLQRTRRQKTTKITQNVQLKFLNERCKNVISLSLTEYSVKSSNTVNTR